MIGAKNQKVLWDSAVGKCVISYDCYNSLHPKNKMELFPSSVRIMAANGTFIANKGECDKTLKINSERFTFLFLCSDQLSQQMIPGHNFSKAYCIGTLWNVDDVMSLTRNGIPFAEMLPTDHVNAYQCISSLGCPRQRGRLTLAGVVCLNHHSNTDLCTHIVTHMKDL